MRRIIYIYIVCIIIFSVILSCSPKGLLYADSVIRVDPTTSEQSIPRLDNDYIVWQDYRSGVSQIYVYDIKAGISFPLDPTNSYQTWASIHENKVVWADDRNGTYQIFFYDLSDPNATPTRIDPTETFQSNPAIFGDIITWTDHRDGGGQIYMYSLVTEAVTRIDPTNFNQISPDIYEDKIVWMDYRDGINQIYLYDIATGISTRISPSSHDQRDPFIFRDKIVWRDEARTPNQIKLYDITTNTTSVLNPSTTSGRRYPGISGKFVTWLGDDSGIDQVYLYNLQSAVPPNRIYPTSEPQDYPVIYSNKIVWSDWNDLGTDPQIYMYTVPAYMGVPTALVDFLEKIKVFFLSIINIFSQVISGASSSSDTIGEEKVKEDEKEAKTDEIAEKEPADKEETEILKEKEGISTEEEQTEQTQQEASEQTQPPEEVPETETTEQTDGVTERTDPDTPISLAMLHPSDIGHIIKYVGRPYVVDTTVLIIGDSTGNTDIRGFFAFDVSSLSGKEIRSARLVLNTYRLHGDPSFKDHIGIRWGTYLPLDPDDYLMLGTHPVTSFDNNTEPIEFSRDDLMVAVNNMANVTPGKLEFAMGYSNDASDVDGDLDGREYRIEDIALYVEYID